MRGFNWQIWAGFFLTVFAFVSYPLIFINWDVTRDFPWANIPMFLIAAVLLFTGVRRAFGPGRRLISKIIAPVLATLSALIVTLFVFVAFIEPRWLPASTGAPQPGQKAPEFTLTDTNNKPVALADLLSQPVANKPPKGVLLIFYRGYW